MFLTHLTSPDSPTYTLDNTSKSKIITNKLISPKNESPCSPLRHWLFARDLKYIVQTLLP